jgi:copper chaperone CopZ
LHTIVIDHLETGTVEIGVDETKVTVVQMRKSIEEQGYDVKV